MNRTPKRGFSLIDFGCRDFKARISRSGNDVVGGEKAWEVGIHMADVDDAVAPLHYRFSPHRNRASLSEPLLPRVPLTVSSSSFSMLSESKPWMDKRVLKNVASTRPLSARIFKAIADPPTTSLQRLKGLTTGGLPTFVDVGNSFSAPAIVEDNFINQKVVMMGDDTWTQLFPHHFERSYPYPSFNVKDLHTVDNGCIEHLLLSLYEEDWDVLIAHFLGVDHAGHIFGVDSTPMIEKLEQYNTILESGPGSSHENTMLVVMGDHGQTLNGDHGGGSAEEVETAIFAMSFKKPLSFVPPEFDSCSCQLDLSIGFLILSTLCRFAIEVGLSKQAATSAFMKDFTSWIINIASGLPVWDYAAEVIPMVVLILLAAWLYKAASGSFFDWPWKCAFDGLRYGAAFIGFEEFVLVRQAILLAIHTFGFSIILPVFGLPLLVATKYQANLGKHFIFTQLSQDLKAEAEAEANVGDVEYQARKTPRQGGYRATYFIFAMMLLDNIGFVANMVSLVLYFMNVMHFDYSGSATTTTNLLGTAFLLTIVGGFISDTYMNRLNTCILFGIIQLLGYSLLVIQSHDKTLQPDPCLKSTCVHGTKALLFYASIYLLALGGGGIRGCVPALGADQFDEKKPKEHAQLASFFNWFLFSITVGASLGVTFVVYVSTESQWYKGFIISMSCSAVGLIFIASGKRFYHARVPGESPLLRVLQVLVVTVRNWRVKVPLDSDELYEIQSHESSLKKKLIPHTNQFRVLDKAAVLPEGNEARRWKVCTVTQVEEVKILTRMMPILLSTIIMNTSLAQLQTFSIQQGTLMNTYIGKLNIPAASIPIIPLVFMTLLIPVYEFAFIPLVRRITGHPNGITELQRVGVGLVLSAISMVIAGVIEVKRKHEFNDHNQHRISLFWLSFHYAIFGIADMFTLVGLLEFFYKEAPQGMRSLSTSFSFLSLSIGYYLSTAFVELINLVTSKIGKSKKGWLEGRDLNRNHVQLFYWFLAILSLINFLIYLMCAKWYKYQSVVPFDKGMLLKDPPPRNDENVYSTSFVSTVQNIPQNEDK
ncbi:Protein NRT1/ PTR FAMILY 4.5 [Glycine max]|nr:Protein NRT1/ PTR FAMILY 4.5 [Glycine max]